MSKAGVKWQRVAESEIRMSNELASSSAKNRRIFLEGCNETRTDIFAKARDFNFAGFLHVLLEQCLRATDRHNGDAKRHRDRPNWSSSTKCNGIDHQSRERNYKTLCDQWGWLVLIQPAAGFHLSTYGSDSRVREICTEWNPP